MSYTTSVSDRHPHSKLGLRIFAPWIRISWLAVVTFTVVLEAMPIPLMPPVPFYSYCAFKAILFFFVGFFSPLAFWHFNAVNRGLLLAAVSAVGVELLQGFLRHGHSFNWYEVGVKLALIFFGFALAIDARSDGQIAIGPWHVRLNGDHLIQ